MTNCKSEKSNSRPSTLLGDSTSDNSNGGKNSYHYNGLLTELTKTAYNHNTRKRDTKVYRGIATIVVARTILDNIRA